MKTILILLIAAGFAKGEIQPGDPIDYSKIAFYPERWEQKGLDLEMVPWKGEKITFLTTNAGFDHKIMGQFVGLLDQGWQTYLKFTGKAPRPGRSVDGLAPIAAIPAGNLTCGAGCGFVGTTGIEANYFYTSTYKNLQMNPKAVPHLYFYEMGRNYFTFGDRHNCFTTGFAVFMRYVCLDQLEVVDNDKGTRKTIENSIDQYAESDLTFLKTFTNAHGLTEKENRLKARPTDQPVMYCSAMLKLWKSLGDDWLKGCFRQLHTLPKIGNVSKDQARTQALGWYLSSSLAAKKDLAPIFVKQWRFPVTEAEKEFFGGIDWKNTEKNAGELLKQIQKK